MSDLSDMQDYIAQKQALLANPQSTVATTQAPPVSVPKTDLEEMNQYIAQKKAIQPTSPQSLAQPGMLNSLARGVAQGATMNFAPRIAAGAQSLYGQVTGTPEDYDTNLKTSQANMDKAKAAHPWMYGAGEMAGIAAPMATGAGEALGAGEGIMGAAKLGAAMGAATGVGASKDLSNIPDVARNATVGGLEGGLAGGATEAALGPIMRQIAPTISSATNNIKNIGPLSSATDAFSQGVQGNALWGEQPGLQANRGLMTQINNAGQTIKEALNNASQDQKGALSSQEPSVDLSDWLKDVYTSALNGKKATSFQENRDAIDQVLGVVNEFVSGSEDSAIPGRGTQVTPLQANELKRQLGLLGTEGNDAMNNPVGRQFANRIISPIKHAPNEVESSFGLPDDFTPLKEEINSSVANLSPANQRISKLLLAQDMLPDANILANSEKASTAGAAANDKLQDFFSTLPDDVRANIQPNLESAAKTAYVANKINAAGLNKNAFSLAESGKGALLGLSNLAGSAVSGIKNAATGAAADAGSTGVGPLFKTMYNQSPETFNTIGNKLVGMGGTAADIGKALIGASQKDNFGRNAIIFTLSQNPAYRNEVEKQFGNGTGIDMGQTQPMSKTSQLEHVNQ